MSETSEKRLEKVRFMNMCMIQDGRGNVLALDKVNDSYTGTTFPGGHVEPGELFFQSMIREVWEETGLTIENPEFRGLYHWHKDGVHHVITLYRTYTFCGELESSEEGRVYWISLEELKTKKTCIRDGIRSGDDGVRNDKRMLCTPGSRPVCGEGILIYWRNCSRGSGTAL